MRMKPLLTSILIVSLVAMVPHLRADERRAPAPNYSPDQLRGVFFSDLSEALRGQRPSLASVRKSAQAAAVAKSTSPATESVPDSWSPLISPASIEDEIKRVRLHYDSVVTTPGAFNSGGYQDARLDLTVLATLFAVINEHGGEVRWKNQAAAARDLIARTADNCKAGSTQVYNEAKLRKADLQDLVSGSGLSNRDAEKANDWAMIADRSPLMEYADLLIEALEDATRNAGSVKREPDLIKRNSQLLSVLGAVFTKEGMDEFDDEDYAKLSRDFSSASNAVAAAIDRNDVDAVRKGTSAIRQRCDACHEQYR
jgi:hypothetical protein